MPVAARSLRASRCLWMEVIVHYNLIALIPARSGSKRLPMKNIRILDGHPLLAYAIQSAKDSELFEQIYVSSDSEKIGEIAIYYGAEFIKRPMAFSQDDSPDKDWINHARDCIELDIYKFAILRPTSPFRTAETIIRAFSEWYGDSTVKAVEPIKQHPGKAWKLVGKKMKQYIKNSQGHLMPTQSLEPLFIQNGSLELRTFGLSNGYQPFFTEGYEGFDINTINDWILAEALVKKGWAKLPKIDKEPYDFSAV